MSEKKQAMCPLFPDLACPQGERASEECHVRVNGEFDPVLYFRDELVIHWAIARSQSKPTAALEK